MSKIKKNMAKITRNKLEIGKMLTKSIFLSIFVSSSHQTHQHLPSDTPAAPIKHTSTSPQTHRQLPSNTPAPPIKHTGNHSETHRKPRRNFPPCITVIKKSATSVVL